VISFEEARTFVLESLEPLSPVAVDLKDALNCVVAETIAATESVPGFANSAMDGYAVRSVDCVEDATKLKVVGVVLAGDTPCEALGPNQAVRVMTGAAIPDGADSVCKIEEALVADGGETVTILRRPAKGENVRLPGEDVLIGQTLVKQGAVLGSTELGLLTGQGITSVLVHPRPRVGVLSTGNELARSGVELGRGEIRDVNRPMLLAALENSGFDPVDLGIVPDDRASLEGAFSSAGHRCDAVISTGGVSVGDVDLVKVVITQLCAARARWMQVAVRPGKPFTFGVSTQGGTPLFGLPGNPVAALVGFELYVRPGLRRLGGSEEVTRPRLAAVLDCPLPRQRDGKQHCIHVDLAVGDDGRVHVRGARPQGSHLISAIAGANGMVMVEDGEGHDVGDVVAAALIGPLSSVTS